MIAAHGVESAEAWVTNNLGKFNGNRARAWEFFLLEAVDSVSKGTAGWDNIEEILYTTVDGNKKYNELLIEKLGGSEKGQEGRSFSSFAKQSFRQLPIQIEPGFLLYTRGCF